LLVKQDVAWSVTLAVGWLTWLLLERYVGLASAIQELPGFGELGVHVAGGKDSEVTGASIADADPVRVAPQVCKDRFGVTEGWFAVDLPALLVPAVQKLSKRVTLSKQCTRPSQIQIPLLVQRAQTGENFAAKQ
jgi:hypothetical protein